MHTIDSLRNLNPLNATDPNHVEIAQEAMLKIQAIIEDGIYTENAAKIINSIYDVINDAKKEAKG